MPAVDEAVRTPDAAATTPQQSSSTVPPVVRVGIGLVVAGVEKAKHLDPMALAALPVRGLAYVASLRETVERTYEELSHRGETVVAKWRHQDAPQSATRSTQQPLTEAAPEVVEAVVDPFGVGEELAEATPGATLAHAELPLEDFDHLTLGQLRARLAKLDAVALVQLRDYERAHADRLPVVTMLENRLAKVTTTEQAQPAAE